MRAITFGALFAIATPLAVVAEVILTPAEIAQTLRHGPWPATAGTDPSNRVSGDPRAIALGQKLFHDPVLSIDGSMTCASCHQPDRDFTDGLERAQGRVLLDRNTQSLWNMPSQRWFGWAGGNDNLWAQSLAPVLHADEMAHSMASLRTALEGSAEKSDFEALFGSVSAQDDIEASVNLSKTLAAYIETLVTGQTSFDRFRDALAEGDHAVAGQFPIAAQRGLQIFLGHGNCSFCHSGPAFTNGEFHDAGVPYFLERGQVDPGRAAGLDSIAVNPFTLESDYNDDPSKAGAWAVRNVRFQHANFGIFRVPSLRRVAHTAPYMHDGSLADLNAVLGHYNTINMERLHADGEAILRPLNLSQGEIGDLRAFLESLSDDVAALNEQ